MLKIQNMMDVNVDLLQWLLDFLIKKTSGGAIKNEAISKKELANELHQPIIKEKKVH